MRDIGMESSKDSMIWEYAKINRLIIVSKDVDTHDLSLIFGNPPKVIWLRLGNCSTKQVEKVLRSHYEAIQWVYSQGELSLLTLFEIDA
ncbi:MAG: DUF5615 family PIN-like protein [Pseudanabaenaceae cyanobacterium bins.68]|nr:DUF5615 family PIN-like protein [Pseudanabaenaceae cyanobacterium bins.68]